MLKQQRQHQEARATTVQYAERRQMLQKYLQQEQLRRRMDLKKQMMEIIIIM